MEKRSWSTPTVIEIKPSEIVPEIRQLMTDLRSQRQDVDADPQPRPPIARRQALQRYTIYRAVRWKDKKVWPKEGLGMVARAPGGMLSYWTSPDGREVMPGAFRLVPVTISRVGAR